MAEAPHRHDPGARAWAGHDLRSAWLRILVPIVVGVIASVAVGAIADVTAGLRLVVGWDAGALVQLAVAWSVIFRADAKETHRRASADDPGRFFAMIVTLVASAFAFFVTVSVMTREAHLSPLWVGLCLGAIALAWLVTHTTWTFRYAHLHYREEDHDCAPSLDFPGDDAPSDIDFAYFAFTLGMCFQVSDVTIKTSAVRREALFHALIAFIYNAAVLAVAINCVV